MTPELLAELKRLREIERLARLCAVAFVDAKYARDERDEILDRLCRALNPDQHICPCGACAWWDDRCQRCARLKRPA